MQPVPAIELLSCSSKLTKPKGGVIRAFDLVTSNQVITEVCIWWEWGVCSLVGLSSSSVGFDAIWVDSVRIELNCRVPSWCHTELLGVGEKSHTFGDQDKVFYNKYKGDSQERNSREELSFSLPRKEKLSLSPPFTDVFSGLSCHSYFSDFPC